MSWSCMGRSIAKLRELREVAPLRALDNAARIADACGRSSSHGERVNTQRKPLPQVDGANLFPPSLSYAYFEHAERYPFDPRVDPARATPSPVQAFWLVDAALLAYAAPDFARPRLAAAGLAGFQAFDAGGSQCFVAHNDAFAIAAFRGTEIKSADAVRDLCTDLDLELVESGFGGRVHAGAKRYLDALWSGSDGLAEYLRALRAERPARPLFLTGHSLGAAVATLAAQRIADVAALYTFGSPRPGDARFRRTLRVSAFRFVNNNDLVPWLPPPLPLPPSLDRYCHLGALQYLDRDGVLHAQLSPRERLADGVRGALAYQLHLQGELARPLQALMHLLDGSFGELPFDALSDHAPLLYALQVWNACMAPAQAAPARHGLLRALKRHLPFA